MVNAGGWKVDTDAEGDDAVKKYVGIAVTESNHVHIGDKTVYNGPVTVNHFVSANEDQVECDGRLTNSDHWKNHYALLVNSWAVPPTEDKRNAEFSASGLVTEWLHDVTISKCCVLGTAASILSVAVVLSLLLVLVVDRNIAPYQTHIQAVKACPSETTHLYLNENDSGTLRVIERGEWHADSVGPGLVKLKLPVKFVTISHTAGKQCFNFTMCACLVYHIQTQHIKHRCWDDIGYNFLVGGDGYIYRGRGWHYKPSHSSGDVDSSISINFIGLFRKTNATDKQILAAKQLIQEGVNLGKVEHDYKLFGLRQVTKSESPGDKLFEEIKTWSHWTNNTHSVKHSTDYVEANCR